MSVDRGNIQKTALPMLGINISWSQIPGQWSLKSEVGLYWNKIKITTMHSSTKPHYRDSKLKWWTLNCKDQTGKIHCRASYASRQFTTKKEKKEKKRKRDITSVLTSDLLKNCHGCIWWQDVISLVNKYLLVVGIWIAAAEVFFIKLKCLMKKRSSIL